MVDKLRVVHPTSDITTTVALRRVDDAFLIHHCDGSPGYLLGGEEDEVDGVHHALVRDRSLLC